MAVVKLYEFRMYDIGNDLKQTSRRKGLEEAIAKMPGAEIVLTSAIEIDTNEVRWDPDYPGLTAVGWFPSSPHRMR